MAQNVAGKGGKEENMRMDMTMVSEESRMTVVQLGKDPLHGGFTEYGGTILYAKAVAIFLNSSHLLIIQVDDLPMNTAERSSAHFNIFRIRYRRGLLFPCQSRLF